MFLTQAFGYGFAKVFSPESMITTPDADTFGWAFVLAAGVAIVMTTGVSRLNEGTAARRWPPVLQGLIAAAR